MEIGFDEFVKNQHTGGKLKSRVQGFVNFVERCLTVLRRGEHAVKHRAESGLLTTPSNRGNRFSHNRRSLIDAGRTAASRPVIPF